MLSPLNWLAQIVSVTHLSLQTIVERKGAATASAFGIAGVVAVFVGVLSIAQGFRHALVAAGDPATALVLRSGSDGEGVSMLMGEDARIVGDFPGVARSANGPIASAELLVIINLPKRSTGTDANVPLRGVGPAAFQVRDRVRMVEGRPFETGRNEIIVGVGAAQAFAGLDLGSRLQVGRNEWTVVGLFTEAGGISESEVWTDAGVLQSAYQRGNTYQSVYAKLTSPEAFGTFKDSITTDPRLRVKVQRQTDYYAEQSTAISRLITTLGSLIAGLMGVGAVFGALNTMYTAVAARTREIATLRALGFGSVPVVVSVMIESLVLATAAGAVGGMLAYFLFNGFRASTINWQSFSQVTFAFRVTPHLLVQGVSYAALIGLVGGVFPAIRAARLPIARALREL